MPHNHAVIITPASREIAEAPIHLRIAYLYWVSRSTQDRTLPYFRSNCNKMFAFVSDVQQSVFLAWRISDIVLRLLAFESN